MVNHLPPKKKKIEKELISYYQKLMADELAFKLNENKLVLKLHEKKNSGRSLQKFAVLFYLKLWVKLNVGI